MPTPDQKPADLPHLRLASAVAFYVGVLVLAAIWSMLMSAGLLPILAIPKDKTLPWWLAGVGAALAIVVVTALAERHSPALRRLSAELGDLVAPVTLPRVLVLAGLSGICEEALFRGPVQQTLGLVPAALVFALLHGGLSRRYLAWSLFALLAGLCFGVLADVYASVAPAAIAHIVVNAINLRRLARAQEPPPAAGQGTEDARG